MYKSYVTLDFHEDDFFTEYILRLKLLILGNQFKLISIFD